MKPGNDAQVEVSYDAANHTIQINAGFFNFNLMSLDLFSGFQMCLQIKLESFEMLEIMADALRQLCLAVDSLEQLDAWMSAVVQAVGSEHIRIAPDAEDQTFFTDFDLALFRDSLASQVAMVDDENEDDNNKKKGNAEIIW